MPQINDQESLIPGKEGTKPCINPITFYLTIQIIPLAAFLIFVLLKITDLSSFFITIIIIGVNFYFIQNVSGIQLVGLRWSLSFSKGIDYYSKPDPFVPQAADSNAFWIGFFVFIVIWVIAFVASLFITSIFAAISIFGVLSEVLNLFMFMNAHKNAKKSTTRSFLMTEVMTGDVNFELVKEDIDIQNYEAQDTENPQIKLALPESQIINNQNGADNGNIDNVEESKQYETNHNVENTKTESPNILNRNGDDSKGTEKEDIKNEKVNGDQNNNSNTVSEFIPNFNENNINFTNNDENDEKPLTFDDNKATFSDANDEDEEVLFQLVDEDDENNKI